MNLLQTKLWTVVHESDYGDSISTVVSKDMPDQDALIKALNIDFEEDRNEYIRIFEVDMDNVVNMDAEGIEVVENGTGIRIVEHVKNAEEYFNPSRLFQLDHISAEELSIISDIIESYKIAMEYDMNKDTFTMMGYTEDAIHFYYERGDNKGFMHLDRVFTKGADENELLTILEHMKEGLDNDNG